MVKTKKSIPKLSWWIVRYILLILIKRGTDFRHLTLALSTVSKDPSWSFIPPSGKSGIWWRTPSLQLGCQAKIPFLDLCLHLQTNILLSRVLNDLFTMVSPLKTRTMGLPEKLVFESDTRRIQNTCKISVNKSKCTRRETQRRVTAKDVNAKRDRRRG